MHPFTADPYEFQVAAEFTLVRSNTGALEIQTRQLAVGAHAIALDQLRDRDAGGRATVELDAGRAMRLIVDHRRRVAAAPARPARRG